MKILRLLMYESNDLKALDMQLSRSLPDGTRDGVKGVKITAITLGDMADRVKFNIEDKE